MAVIEAVLHHALVLCLGIHLAYWPSGPVWRALNADRKRRKQAEKVLPRARLVKR